MLIGAGLAVLGVAVIVALVALGVVGPARPSDSAAQGPVLVALVLADQSGVQQPRVVDAYTKQAAGWDVSSVSPTLPATVSGTSGTTLADAYSFGGGNALLNAYNELGKGQASAWIVVDEAAWKALVGGQPVTVDIPAHMEVYDGRRLVPFNQGPASISATQTSTLLLGAGYLTRADNAQLRASVGDVLAARLKLAGATNVGSLKSNLEGATLAAWAGKLGALSRVAGD
jgi:hypothetical protein